MEWAFKPVDIEEDGIRVRRMKPNDFYGIAESIHDPESFIAKTWEINTPDKIIAMLAKIHSQHLLGQCNPFVFEYNGKIAGISRFFRFDEKRRSLEIGGTWIAPHFRRTIVNTKAKYLMMKVAFEEFGMERIEYVVNEKNYISQVAVLRLGAVYEGELRRCYVGKSDENIDAKLYSIIKPDWVQIKSRLTKLIKRESVVSDFLPYELNSETCYLKPYCLADADSLRDLVRRNYQSLITSLPKTARVANEVEPAAFIAERYHQFRSKTGGTYGIWSEKNQLIGQIAVQNLNWDLKEADVGYYIDSEMRQQGIATKMLKLMINYLMTDLAFNRLTIRTLPENNASIHLAKKLGFQQEGILRSAFVSGQGDRKDILLLALTK